MTTPAIANRDSSNSIDKRGFAARLILFLNILPHWSGLADDRRCRKEVRPVS
jgi:hypothetical protein